MDKVCKEAIISSMPSLKHTYETRSADFDSICCPGLACLRLGKDTPYDILSSELLNLRELTLG